MVATQQNLRLLTLQHELSMLIGQDLDLEKMLDLFLPKTLSYLNCIGGYIWLHNKITDKLERFFSYPNEIIDPSPVLLQQLEKLVHGGIEGLPQSYIHLTDGTRTHNYILAIGSIGFILLQCRSVLTEQLLSALKPIFKRLAIACVACLQYTQTESRYQNIFENSPISLWEEDFSALKQYLEELKAVGIDIATYFETNPQEVLKCASMIRIENVNKVTLELFKAGSKQELIDNFLRIFNHNVGSSLNDLKSRFVAIADDQKMHVYETSCHTLTGEEIHIIFKYSVIPGYANFAKVLVSIVDITQLKILQQQLAYSAVHDPLTGLANRTLFHESLKNAINRARRTQQPMALLYLDLDHFKAVNDSFGHAIGDDLLVEIAKRLTAVVREDDVVTRLGGDEFAIILNGLNSVKEAAEVAARIDNIVRTPMIIAGHRLMITVSTGIAVYDVESVLNLEQLIKNADNALYAAKKAGRNTWLFYS